MRRPALLPLLALLWITSYVASCGSVPASPVAAVPSSTAIEAAVPSPTPGPVQTHTLTPLISPSFSLSSTSTSTSTATPSHTPTPSASPTPTLPPLVTPATGPSLPVSLGWRLDANGHLTAGRSIEGEGQPLFLLASLGRTVYALTAAGQTAWQLRTEGPVYTLASLDASRMVAGDDAGVVTLFDDTGQPLWQSQLGSRVTAVRAGWQQGVLAGGWDERLTLLSGEGKIVWQADVSGPLSGIAILPELAVASTLDGHVQAFAPDGQQVWQFDAGIPVTGLEAAGQGERRQLLLGLQDGHLLALDADGTPQWQRALGTGGPIWHIAQLPQDPSPEIIAGTGGKEPALALLSTDGQIAWRVGLASPVGALTALDLDGDGTLEILAGLTSGQVQAYDRQGQLRGSTHAGLSVWGLETAGDGSTLILADVVAWKLDGRSGSTLDQWLPAPPLAKNPADPAQPAVSPKQDEAILVFLGDVALGRSMEAQLARFGAAHPWEALHPLLREADLAVANLEGVLTTQGTPLNKSYLIRAHPRWGRALVEADIDLVTLANNHALDYGPAGLDETLSTLQALDIATVGAGSSQGTAKSPATFELNGVRVAVLGYAAARWNGSEDVPSTDRLAWAEPDAVQADVLAIRDRADLVVVLLHAGTEYASTPSSDQVAVAHTAIDAGADLVVGHHPHVTQTVERYKGGLIVYSLGDALFDIPRPAAMQGDLLRVHVTQKGLVQAELWPFWIEDSIRPRLLDDGSGGSRFKIIYP